MGPPAKWLLGLLLNRGFESPPPRWKNRFVKINEPVFILDAYYARGMPCVRLPVYFFRRYRLESQECALLLPEAQRNPRSESGGGQRAKLVRACPEPEGREG
jgi:hypothetical protein